MNITRSFEIDYGHRLMLHESKCRSAHGHRGVFEVTVALPDGGELDKVGRIIDFGVVKSTIGGWLNDTLDHGFIVERGDPLHAWLEVHEQKRLVLDVPPSIENLARYVYENASRLMERHNIKVVRVRAYETSSCFADFP